MARKTNNSAASKGSTVTAAKAARKAASAAKAAGQFVPGYPKVPVVTGKGTTGRTIATIVSANRGQDQLAILNDGSKHPCTKHLGAGVAVKPGMLWDTVNSQLLAIQRSDAEARSAAPKPSAGLATGVDARSAPHSAKAVSDQRGAGKAAKAAKPDKAAKKAARAAKAAPKADDARKIKLVDKKYSYGGEGTARRASWDAARSSATVQAYLKAGGKAKYLPRFVAAGAIQLVG